MKQCPISLICNRPLFWEEVTIAKEYKEGQFVDREVILKKVK